jgi:hypothetical protein
VLLQNAVAMFLHFRDDQVGLVNTCMAIKISKVVMAEPTKFELRFDIGLHLDFGCPVKKDD